MMRAIILTLCCLLGAQVGALSTTAPPPPPTPTAISTRSVEVRPDEYGARGLFASEKIAAGSDVLSVPDNLLVYRKQGKNTLIEQVGQSVCPSNDNSCDVWWLIASLAVWRLGIPDACSTAVNLHCQELPFESAHWQLPLLWPEQTLKDALLWCQTQANDRATQRQVGVACQDIQRRVKHLKDSSQLLSDHLYPHLQQTFSQQSVHQACLEATALVLSRTRFPNSRRTVLVTMMDLANHSDHPNAMFQDDLDPDGPVRLVALRNIQPDEPITINYGVDKSGISKSVAIFWSGYGFVPDNLAAESVSNILLQAAVHRGQEMASATIEQQAL